MKAVAWFQIVVGLAMAGLWLVLVAGGDVPQLDAGQVDILFHIATELITAVLLVAAGILVLRHRMRVGHYTSAFALGALLYTCVNSAGYYAELGDWAPVGMFGVVAVLTTGAFLRVLGTAKNDITPTTPNLPVEAGTHH